MTVTSQFFGHRFDFATNTKNVVDAHDGDANEKHLHKALDERTEETWFCVEPRAFVCGCIGHTRTLYVSVPMIKANVCRGGGF